MLTTLCLSLVLIQNQTPPAPPTLPAAPPATAAASQTVVDRSTPEATIRSFFGAFLRGDLKSAVTCVQGSTFAPIFTELEGQIKKSPIPFLLDTVDVKMDGDKATASLKMKSSAAESKDNFDDEITLNKVAGNWLIVPSDFKTLEKESRTRLVSMLATMLANPSLLQLQQARGNARQTTSLTNIKQIALGALMFVQDHDEKFALKAATYKKSIMPYIKSEAIFHAPGDTSKTESYAFNPYLQGQSMTKVDYPARTVLIYEGRDRKLDFRYHGMAAVAFVDGHAMLISPARAKTLRWTP